MTTNPSTSATAVKDPVCGMNVNPATAKHQLKHAGKPYYFCCGPCSEKFKADPDKYLLKPALPHSSGLVTLGRPVARPAPAPVISSASHQGSYVCPMCPKVRESKPGPCPSCGMALDPETPLAATRTEYTCPMHPEIVRPGPGSCPICGMALEPRTVTAAAEENPELRDMTRRFWVSVVLTVPLLGMAMGSMIWPQEFMQILGGVRLPGLEFALATPVVLWCGLPFFQRFWTSLVNR